MVMSGNSLLDHSINANRAGYVIFLMLADNFILLLKWISLSIVTKLSLNVAGSNITESKGLCDDHEYL